MINKPGVSTFLSGDREKAREFLPIAFGLLEEHLRSKPEYLEIDKFTRQIDGGTITVNIHHNTAEIHVFAAPLPELKQVARIDGPSRRPTKRTVEERHDFIRLYVHVDVIMGADAISGPDHGAVTVSSAIAAAIYDVDSGGVYDVMSAIIPYRVLKINSGDLSFEYEQPLGIIDYGKYPDWFVSEAVNTYESILPSMNGQGATTLAWDTPLFIRLVDAVYIDAANDRQYVPFDAPSAPYYLEEVWRDGSSGSPYTVPPSELCHTLYHTPDLWSASYRRSQRMTDLGFGCDLVSVYRGASMSSWAFKSRAYGDIFNGAVRADGAEGIVYYVCASDTIDYLNQLLAPGPTRINGFRTYHHGPTGDYFLTESSPNAHTQIGFNTSFRLPDGTCAYGESVHANVFLPGSSYARGLLNINATIGRDLIPFEPELWTLDETTNATAAFKQLYQLAVETAGGFIEDPLTAPAGLATQQITSFGHAAVDIRTLPGTMYGSPIANVKLYAAPISIKKSRIEEDYGRYQPE